MLFNKLVVTKRQEPLRKTVRSEDLGSWPVSVELCLALCWVAEEES